MQKAWELLGLSVIEVLDYPPHEIKRHPTLNLLYNTQGVYIGKHERLYRLFPHGRNCLDFYNGQS